MFRSAVGVRIGSAILVGCALSLAGQASAATVNAGDIIVADSLGAAIWAVDPGSGDQTLITQGDLLLRPDGLAVDSTGNLWISDVDANAVIHVDIASGDQTLLANGFAADFSGYERMPLELGPDGLLYVARLGAITSVDPMTGTKSVIYDQPFVLGYARAIAFDGAGRLWAASSVLSTLDGALIRFDSASDPLPDILCHQTIVSVDPCGSGGGFWSDPGDMVFDIASGYMVIAMNSAGAVSKLDPVTGVPTGIGGPGSEGIALALFGYYVTSAMGGGELVHVDRLTGASTTVSTLENLGFRPWDIEVALVTVVPEPSLAMGLTAGALFLMGLGRRRPQRR